jgi:hypothetical protein
MSNRSRVGKTKVGGIDLYKPRMRWVVDAVIALRLSLSPHGFTASELARQVRVPTALKVAHSRTQTESPAGSSGVTRLPNRA